MEKSAVGRERVREEKDSEERRSEKIQVREKVEKSRNTVFSNVSAILAIWGCRKSAHRCGGKHIWTSKCEKHSGFGALVKVEMLKKCTALWREAHFQVKMYKTPQLRRNLEVACCKVHGVVARSALRSQNVSDTTHSDHFWKLQCRKSAPCSSTKHILKYTCQKRTTLGPLFGRSTVPRDDDDNNNNSKNISKNNYNNNSKNNYTTTTATTTSTTTATTTTTRHYSYNYGYSYRYIALHYTYKHYTTLCHTTLHYHYNYNNYSYSYNGNYN